MFKSLFILASLLLAKSFLFGQHPEPNDYKVYSALIGSEIGKTTKSVVVINKFENDSSSARWVIEAIKSKDPQQLAPFRLLTRDGEGKGVDSIDGATQKLILGFYETRFEDSVMTNLFHLKAKVFVVDHSPFSGHTKTEWQDFYKKYPGSGGLFQFSPIYYSPDKGTAIFYHSLLRNGLNGHGALVIMTKIDGVWKIKYHINFWQA